MNKRKSGLRTRDDLNIVRGTVLAIPITPERWVLGQVLHPGTSFYLGVATDVLHEPYGAIDINGRELRLFSWTNDAEVYRGNWRNLGEYDIQRHPPFPEYRVLVSGREMVESFAGGALREFETARDGKLQTRKSRSPLLVQDAAAAAGGFGPWRQSYEEMLLR